MASAKRRKSKKVIKEILSDVLSLPVSSVPAFANAARKLGIECEKSVREFYVIVCLMNEMKEGNLDSLAKIIEMTKENGSAGDNGAKYESTNIYVLPSAKDGKDVILPERKAEDDACP